eukprot:m.52493 g.52493  ORF g.52493 m.52493 type:complete len:104 (+) comp21617_c0_seq1:424-735(+)
MQAVEASGSAVTNIPYGAITTSIKCNANTATTIPTTENTLEAAMSKPNLKPQQRDIAVATVAMSKVKHTLSNTYKLEGNLHVVTLLFRSTCTCTYKSIARSSP